MRSEPSSRAMFAFAQSPRCLDQQIALPEPNPYPSRPPARRFRCAIRPILTGCFRETLETRIPIQHVADITPNEGSPSLHVEKSANVDIVK